MTFAERLARMEAVIARHLPPWEPEMCPEPQHGQNAAASLVMAARWGYDTFHAAPLKKDAKALDELEKALAEARQAAAKLSPVAAEALNRHRAAVDHPIPSRGAPRDLLDLCGPLGALRLAHDALAPAFDPARDELGGRIDLGKTGLREAAVADACAEIWAERTGAPAPVVRDRAPEGGTPVPFEAFVRDVFDELGLRGRVATALRAAKRLADQPQTRKIAGKAD